MPNVNTSGGPAGLTVHFVNEVCAMGEVDRCLAVVYRGQPSPEDFRTRNGHLVELAKRSPGKCALVELVEANAKPPSQETRRVAMEVFKQLGGDLSAIGFVLEGSEVRAALIRAALTGMMFFVKQLQPTKVFKQVGDMAAWVGPRMHVDDPNFAAELAKAFEHLRQLVHSNGTAATP